MERSVVLYKKRDGVAYVTLNRPRALNALNDRMHVELAEIWDDVESDKNVLVCVITGAGNRAFSVGQDLKESAQRNDSDAAAILSTFGSIGKPGYPRLTERFKISKPLIARVHGLAMGGGFELALACDIIVASAVAEFALPEAKLGLIPGAGGVFRLLRQIPSKTAMGYLLTGRRMTASRAYELGLVNEVVPVELLDERVDAWVTDILRCAPLSVKAIKEAALSSDAVTLEEAFLKRYVWEEIRSSSLDAREGIRAFIEKRTPKWLGS